MLDFARGENVGLFVETPVHPATELADRLGIKTFGQIAAVDHGLARGNNARLNARQRGKKLADFGKIDRRDSREQRRNTSVEFARCNGRGLLCRRYFLSNGYRLSVGRRRW
jgi:hypothetical protein